MSASTPQDTLRMYEEATNTHVFDHVAPLISDDAVYFFSDETVTGLESLKRYFEKTWSLIQDETYAIDHVEWITAGETTAVCVYQFHWTGKVNGRLREGSGRGTNVLKKLNGHWKMAHEHLSTLG